LTGILEQKRKSMHISDKSCDATHAGVDLNRNYGYKWGETEDTHNGKKAETECSTESFMGVKPFSEPETQAMRDFLTANKDQIDFVYNLHCAGN
jgi:hypothetical protein